MPHHSGLVGFRGSTVNFVSGLPQSGHGKKLVRPGKRRNEYGCQGTREHSHALSRDRLHGVRRLSPRRSSYLGSSPYHLGAVSPPRLKPPPPRRSAGHLGSSPATLVQPPP